MNMEIKVRSIRYSRGYFGSWGRVLVAFSVVKRFKEESMYGLSAGTRKSGCCREVAIVEVRQL